MKHYKEYTILLFIYLMCSISWGQEIALDPNNGGRSIDSSELMIGDIILSTTDAWISEKIRKVIDSDISHTILYIGNNQIVEAGSKGVVLKSLDDALSDATVAAAFRYENMNYIKRLIIKDFAGYQLGKKYSGIGIIKHLGFKLDYNAFCKSKLGDARESCKKTVRKINLGKGNNNSFFCSELVIAAFQYANLDLTKNPPNWTTPDDIRTLALKDGVLAYIGHLRN